MKENLTYSCFDLEAIHILPSLGSFVLGTSGKSTPCCREDQPGVAEDEPGVIGTVAASTWAAVVGTEGVWAAKVGIEGATPCVVACCGVDPTEASMGGVEPDAVPECGLGVSIGGGG